MPWEEFEEYQSQIGAVRASKMLKELTVANYPHMSQEDAAKVSARLVRDADDRSIQDQADAGWAAIRRKLPRAKKKEG